jgi:Zinc-binding dehydrogenase
VQLAKAFGATVTGVASTAKAGLVRSIGADQVIDYTREDFADGHQHYDLILDIGGNSRLSRLRRALTPKGTLVIAGGEDARWTGVGRQIRALALSPVVPQRLTMYISAHRQADLEALRQQVEAGHVTPIVGKTYPLSEVPEAIRHLEGGRHKERSPLPSKLAGALGLADQLAGPIRVHRWSYRRDVIGRPSAYRSNCPPGGAWRSCAPPRRQAVSVCSRSSSVSSSGSSPVVAAIWLISARACPVDLGGSFPLGWPGG